MKHYISICADLRSTTATKCDLFEWSVLVTQPQFAKKNKEDSMLVFNGYCSTENEYPRKESSLNKTSSIFIDCDNPSSDPNIIDKWRERMSGYDYLIYETASSTPERPKFRAIIPMDGEVDWNKYVKRAVFNMFSEFADPKASWFFSPTLDKLDTIEENTTGRWFPAHVVVEQATRLKQLDDDSASLRALTQLRHTLGRTVEFKQNSEGWRNLPSVKKCLEGLHVGERDNALCAACYAMDKRGYRSSIREFLDECDVEIEFKNKWKSRYR